MVLARENKHIISALSKLFVLKKEEKTPYCTNYIVKISPKHLINRKMPSKKWLIIK